MTTLLLLLRALSKEQMRALEKFIHSPYHVTHAGVVQLFEFLKKYSHDSQLDKAAVERHFHSDADPRRLYHLTNYLLEAVENFLSTTHWEKQEHLQHAATVEALRRLHLPEPAAGMLRYARKRLEQEVHRGLDYHLADYHLHREAYFLSLQQGRAKSFNAQELSDAQDVVFICEKLRTGCLLLSHQAVTQQTYDKGLLDNVLDFLRNHRYLEIPAIAAYYHGYHAQLGGADSEQHFSTLKAVLEQHAALFPLAETHDLFLMAINFCIRRINQQDERYLREILDLYQSGLRHGALLEDGRLSRWTYNNITSAGLRLGEFAWVWQFIHEYAPLLTEEHRFGASHFNIARYHYKKGELREAMQHLLHIEYDDVLQNLTAKTMLSQIYYRLDEIDALENQLDNIQIYIRRKKVLGYHRDSYLAFVRFTRKLLALTASDNVEKERLRSDIDATPVVAEKEWLLSELGH
jgi:hypothetical protein